MTEILRPRIKDIVDLKELSAMVSEFTRITGIPFTMLDTKGTVLIRTGDLDVCSCYHQAYPSAKKRCSESLETLLNSLDLDEPYTVRHCSNGMVQAACPVFINKQYAACITMCHFFDKTPDLDAFRKQAKELEIDEDGYIELVAKTLVRPSDEIEHIMSFYQQMASMIGKFGFQRKQLRELIDIQSDLNHRLNNDIHERKKTENRLRERERQMATLFDNLPGMAYRCANEHSWKMSFVSEGSQELCGYTPEEIINNKSRSWNDVIHPDDREMVWTAVQDALAADQAYLVQYRIITRDGITRHVWEKGRGISEEGSIHTLEGFIMDISDEYLAKKQLNINRKRIKLFAENARDILYRMSLPDGQYEYISPAMERITGHSVEEFYEDPMAFDRHLHPDSVDYINRERENLINDRNIPPSYEFKIIAKNGETKWLHQRNALIRDEEGTLTAIEGIVTDLTEVKKTQLALKKNEALLRAAQIAGKIGNWEFDMQTLKFHSSPFTRELAHIRTQSPDTPATLDDFISSIHQDDRARIAAKVKNALMTKKGFEDEWRVHRDDSCYVRVIVKFETDLHTGEAHCWGTLQDVSEQRSVDKEVSQSQKMGTAERLAGGIAHDFNNLLHAILGYAEIITEQTAEDADVQHNMKMLTNAAEKARILTDKLLAFSCKEGLALESMDLNNTIRQHLPLLNSLTGPSCTIVFKDAPSLRKVNADPKHIKQILINLCLNSQQAMLNGGTITMKTQDVTLDDASCRNDPDLIPGEYVILTLEDTGSGIPPEIIEKVFDPLFTTRKREKGTGLGLAITYASVKSHNGKITIANREQGGTLVTVFIPAISSTTTPATTPPETISMLPGGGNETILLAEDDELVCKVSEDILTRMGYQLLIAHDGQEAVDLFMANRDSIDLLVLDIVMPNINGCDVYNIIAKEKPDIPVLFCSGYNEDILHSNFLLSVPGMMIHKPYSNKELLHSVRFLLNK